MLNSNKILKYSVVSALGLFLIFTLYMFHLVNNLPQIISVQDYKPSLVSKVYDRKAKEIGEFFRERRIVLSSAQIPEKLKQAFIAAEDSDFYKHSGINYVSILRATLANIKAGRKVQGGSTITQQVAKSLLLSPEKTYTRKIREMILAQRMENNLSKDDILYLYLNQIYFGQGAYGVEAASNAYFKKSVNELKLEEMAILAGLPQAPSRYSPTRNSMSAKNRQLYVLQRMLDEKYISEDEYNKAVKAEVYVYMPQDISLLAPFFVETVRQELLKSLGEKAILDEGIRIYTSLDLDKQLKAQKEIQIGLRQLDKRRGYRGPYKNIKAKEEIESFLTEQEREQLLKTHPYLVIMPDGSSKHLKTLNSKNIKPSSSNLPAHYEIGALAKALVLSVHDALGLVELQLAGTKALIDFDTMKWARKPDTNKMQWEAEIKKPSEALKAGDIIEVKITSDTFNIPRMSNDIAKAQKAGSKIPELTKNFAKYVEAELEQEPKVEGSLLSFDLKTKEVISMVGGYDFKRSEFNRALQAVRQTGSSFKPLVYLAALDRNFTPVSKIIDAPIVYENQVPSDEGDDSTESVKWKPHNYSEKFVGDVLFRNALIKSMNIPTIKIQIDIGLNTVSEYAKRLGIFSPLNMDHTLGLGSSSASLYEMTRSYAHIAQLGKRFRPIFIHKVSSASGELLLSQQDLDTRYTEETKAIEEAAEKKRQEALAALQNTANPEMAAKYSPLYFDNPDQLLKPQTAYLLTSILQAAVQEGTGARAKALGRPVAGKTGTTNGYYDAWFVGYTPQIVTGVWVGLDDQGTLGRAETGATSALPIWVEYMRYALETAPVESFDAPEGIVFANIDNDTGRLANSSSKNVVRQAFAEGTEPGTAVNIEQDKEDENELLRESLDN